MSDSAFNIAFLSSNRLQHKHTQSAIAIYPAKFTTCPTVDPVLPQAVLKHEHNQKIAGLFMFSAYFGF